MPCVCSLTGVFSRRWQYSPVHRGRGREIVRANFRPPGAEVPGIDQIPESLFPLLALQRPLGLGIVDILVVAAAFAVLDIATTKLRHLYPRDGGCSRWVLLIRLLASLFLLSSCFRALATTGGHREHSHGSSLRRCSLVPQYPQNI